MGLTRGTLGVLIQAYHADLITADQLRFYFDQISERPTSGSAPPYASGSSAKFWRQRVDDSDRIDRR